jgi:hypothetical protein
MYPYNTKYGRGLYSSTYPVSQKQPDLYLFLYSNDRINNGNLISKKSEMIKAINMKSHVDLERKVTWRWEVEEKGTTMVVVNHFLGFVVPMK